MRETLLDGVKTPFKTALRTVETVEDIVVVMETDDGRVGYGEAPATAVITGDTHGSIIEAITRVIRPRLIGQDISNLNQITQIIQNSLERNYSAKAAVDMPAPQPISSATAIGPGRDR